MNIDRLKKLSAHLKGIPAAQRRGEHKRKFTLDTLIQRGPFKYLGFRQGCGTAACALGEACFIPEFRRAGLRVDTRGRLSRFDFRRPTVRYKSLTNNDAVQHFFGLGTSEFVELFINSSYPRDQRTNPLAVAARIDARIAGL